MLKFLVGLLIGVSLNVAYAQIAAEVTTNGTLLGYIVQKDGNDICADPKVWTKPFSQEAPNGYIVCE